MEISTTALKSRAQVAIQQREEKAGTNIPPLCMSTLGFGYLKKWMNMVEPWKIPKVNIENIILRHFFSEHRNSMVFSSHFPTVNDYLPGGSSPSRLVKAGITRPPSTSPSDATTSGCDFFGRRLWQWKIIEKKKHGNLGIYP